MRRITFLIFLAIGTSFICCNMNGKEKSDTMKTTVSDTMESKKNETKQLSIPAVRFDINTVPISNADLGKFPFFGLPQGLETQMKPIQRSFDKLFFPIDGVMIPMEGKVWKSNIYKAENNNEDWSLAYFEKSYDDAIKNVGGAKIFDGKITNDEYERYKDQAPYLGEDASVGYSDQDIKVYVIRRSNGDDIYIQLTGFSAMGYLNILQKVPFKQTITMIQSDQIKKDLNEKGKAVLHINFDSDKATLKPEGKTAVDEISKALQSDANLKISINGYTDNSGNDSHNLQLSKDRAETIKQALVSEGIANDRLTSDGYGSKDPIAENSSEEGKAQNRRVEFIKR